MDWELIFWVVTPFVLLAIIFAVLAHKDEKEFRERNNID